MVPRKTIDDWSEDFADTCLAKDLPFPPGFEPPIYNVWKQQTIKGWTDDFSETLAAKHSEFPFGFTPPIYNVWKQQTIKAWEEGFSENPEDGHSEFPPGFEPPIYNVWKQQTKSNAVSHFGNSEVEWVCLTVQRSSAARCTVSSSASLAANIASTFAEDGKSEVNIRFANRSATCISRVHQP